MNPVESASLGPQRCGHIDTRGLHSKANTEIGRSGLPSVLTPAACQHSAFAESAGHQNGVIVMQIVLVLILHQVFRFDPIDVNAEIVGNTGVCQSFAQ